MSFYVFRWLFTKTSRRDGLDGKDHLTGLSDIAASIWVTEHGGIPTHSHFGGLEHDLYFSIFFHFIYGMSFPLTNSIIFQDGFLTTNQPFE